MFSSAQTIKWLLWKKNKRKPNNIETIGYASVGNSLSVSQSLTLDKIGKVKHYKNKSP